MTAKKMECVECDDITGKTVAGCGWKNERVLITFTDGTCLALEAQDDTGDGIEIEVQSRDIDLMWVEWFQVAYQAGAISSEEMQSVKDYIRNRQIEQHRNQLKWLESQQGKS